MKTYLKKVLAVLIAFFWMGYAAAQPYPNKPVRIVVGYIPGGAPDVVARLLAQRLGTVLGQQVIVENKLGAGGTLANSYVAKAPADGYTLLLGETGQLAITPYTYKKLNYDPVNDFKPVAVIVSTSMVLVSNAKTTNIKTLDDLVRETKANPGKFDYGTGGIGSIHQLTMESMKAELGIDLNHIPYKGGAFPALLAGEVPVMFISLPQARQNVGAVNIIAVSSKERHPLMPNVPAISETAKGFDFTTKMGVLAPSGTPPEVVAKLTSAIHSALFDTDLHDRFKTLGYVIAWGTSDVYVQDIRNDLQKYARATKLAQIKPE